MKVVKYVAIVSIVLILFGCKEDKNDSVSSLNTFNKVTHEDTLQFLVNVGFPKELIEEKDDVFVIDGCIVFRKSEIPDLSSLSKIDQARTTYIVSDSKAGKIKLKIDESISAWSSIILEAIHNWNWYSTKLHIEVVSSNPDIIIYSDQSPNCPTDISNLPSNVCGQGRFPSYDGSPGSAISINMDVPYINGLFANDKRETLITHELGHCIGFRHTNWQSLGESTASTILGTPTTDGSSVMNGGTCGEIIPLSYYDEVAIDALYHCSDWNTVSGATANDIGVSSNGTVCIIGTGFRDGGHDIYKWNGSVWTQYPGGAVSIDVDPNGIPWIVNSYGNIFRWNNDTWQQLPGSGRDIGVGSSGTVYLIGTGVVGGGYGIWYWNGSGWTSVDGGAVRISVDQNGTPWIVNAYGNIFRRSNNTWEQLPGSGRDIGVGANGKVYIIGTNSVDQNYGIFTWNGSSWDYQCGAAVAVDVAADGTPWIVNAQGTIFHK